MLSAQPMEPVVALTDASQPPSPATDAHTLTGALQLESAAPPTDPAASSHAVCASPVTMDAPPAPATKHAFPTSTAPDAGHLAVPGHDAAGKPRPAHEPVCIHFLSYTLAAPVPFPTPRCPPTPCPIDGVLT